MIELLRTKVVRERADRSSLRTEYRQLNEEDCSDTFQGSIDVIRTGSSVVRADDWIRASMDLFTRQVPFSVEPHRQVSAFDLEVALGVHLLVILHKESRVDRFETQSSAGVMLVGLDRRT